MGREGRGGCALPRTGRPFELLFNCHWNLCLGNINNFFVKLAVTPALPNTGGKKGWKKIQFLPTPLSLSLSNVVTGGWFNSLVFSKPGPDRFAETLTELQLTKPTNEGSLGVAGRPTSRREIFKWRNINAEKRTWPQFHFYWKGGGGKRDYGKRQRWLIHPRILPDHFPTGTRFTQCCIVVSLCAPSSSPFPPSYKLYKSMYR